MKQAANQNPVVYIITKLELGGAQKICLSLFHALRTAQTTFLISGTQGVLVDTIKDLPNVILLDTLKREASVLAVAQELKTFIQLIQTLKKLKKEHPTIIAHTHSTKAGILGRWAALVAGQAALIVVAGNLSKNKMQ